MKEQLSLRNLALIYLTTLVFGIPGISYAHSDSEFEQIFIFGDSLSDPGNIFELTGLTSEAPFDIIPSAPYKIGGHQFSNGKTWAQQFARNMKLKKGGKAALDKPVRNGNYAFGGARARSGSGSLSDATSQIMMYFGDHGSADSNALYVVQFGGNDVRDALVVAADPDSFGAAIVILQTAIEATIDNIRALYDSGARNFMVANVPNIALAPAIRFAGAEGAAGFFVGVIYNPGLESALASLEGLEGISITRLDFFDFTNSVADAPEDFGITNTVDMCLTPGVDKDAVCKNPDEYLFWDGIHPTAAAHSALGDIAAALFKEDDDDDDGDDD